jgi:mycothiol synthase
MSSQISIRPATLLPELAAVLDVARRVSREPLPGPDELAHVLAVEPGALFLLAHVEDEIAGSGVGRISSLECCFYAVARVLPGWRKRGAGAGLYRALSEQARSIGRTSLVTRVRDDDEPSLRFARKRGFEEISRQLTVVLRLDDVDDSPVETPGVEIVSLAERPELAEGAWDVDGEASRDIPVERGLTRPSFEQWRGIALDIPNALPEAILVAVADGEVVGYASLYALSDGVAEHGLTAVRRAWRGRGIATALKRSQIAWAKRAGYAELHTMNDEANKAMRGINERLGYLPQPAWLMLRGPLAS